MQEYEHKQEFDVWYQYQKKRVVRLRWVMRLMILGGLGLTFILAGNFVSPTILLVGMGAVALAARALKGKIDSIEDEFKTLKSYTAMETLGQGLSSVNSNTAMGTLGQGLSSVKEYNPFSMMRREDVDRVMIPGVWHDVTGSDFVEGAYKGVPLRFSDVKMVYYVEDKDGESHPKTTFAGQVFALRMKTPVNGKVWIGRFPDDESSMLTRAVYETRVGAAVTNVAALERQSVFASNPEAAAQLLTDEYTGKLRQACNRGDGTLFLCFDGDTLYGAKDSSRDLFENEGEQDWDTMKKSDQRELDRFLELIDCLSDNPALFDRTN